MKKIIFVIGISFVANVITFAQKIAYVDSEYILSKIPEYKKAQDELDKTSAQWQKEIEGKYEEINKMRKIYEAEQILLSDEMRKKEKLILLTEKTKLEIYKNKDLA